MANKKITFNYDGKDYTLEFTRRTVQEMEADGFRPTLVEEMPATYVPMLFAGAFKAHHRFTKQEVINEIYETFPNKTDLLAALGEMYSAPILALMDEPDPEEKEGKNIVWEVVG